MAVYKDTTQPIDLRVLAAKAAIGYEKPWLAAVAGNVGGGPTLEELLHASCRVPARSAGSSG